MICTMDNGNGKTLAEKVKEKHKNYLSLVTVVCNKELSFYESCGFGKANNASPMFITDLWT